MEMLSEDGEMMASINVTSLVDVMFCLLIAFMVASPLMAPEEKIEIDLPVARGQELTEAEFLAQVISVDAKGRVFLGVLALGPEPEKMAEQLRLNAKLKEAGWALIQGDKEVQYDRIIDVLVALEQAEIYEVGFLTDPRQGGLL